MKEEILHAVDHNYEPGLFQSFPQLNQKQEDYHMLSNLYYDTIRGTSWKHVASLETIFQSTICIMISVGCTSVGTVFLVQIFIFIFIFNKLKHLHSEPLLFQKEKSWLQL